MKGFPRHINTKRDFENLLAMPEYEAQALTELKRIQSLNDSKITKATTQKDPEDPESDWDTTEVINPDPTWKRLKFKSKKELTDLIATTEVASNGKQKAN